MDNINPFGTRSYQPIIQEETTSPPTTNDQEKIDPSSFETETRDLNFQQRLIREKLEIAIHARPPHQHLEKVCDEGWTDLEQVRAVH